MSKSTSHKMSEVIGRHLTTHRHTAMLSAIIFAFVVRPLIGDNEGAEILFPLALVALMIVALYSIQIDELVGEEATLQIQHRITRRVGWPLAATAACLRFAMLFSSSPSLKLIGEFSWVMLFGFVTWNELRGVLRQKEITGESISMAISVYLLFGATWSFLYDIIYQLQPMAFSLNGTASALVSPGHPIFPVLGYFSFITLTTVGYGDIAPMTLQARYAAWAEGAVGQFYLAILVARLVSMQLAYGAAPNSAATATDAGDLLRQSAK
jgi:voltage-gated potassium channel